MASITTAPYVAPGILGSSSSLVFSSGGDGVKTVYIGEKLRQFEGTVLKTESAYGVYEARTANSDTKEIIESGRLAVLKIKNGTLQGILIHPELQLISDVSKFILFMANDKGKTDVIALEMTVGKLNQEQYKKLALKFLK